MVKETQWNRRCEIEVVATYSFEAATCREAEPMRRLPRRNRTQQRRGNVVVLSAVMMVAMLGLVAFAVDLGLILTARTELQRSADAAALSAAWELINEANLGTDPVQTSSISDARTVANDYAGRNVVRSDAPTVDLNANNAADGDVVFGYLANPADPAAAMDYSNPAQFNAVTVRVRRNATRNGAVTLFFARIFGVNESSLEAEATAVVNSQVSGFRVPYDGSNLGILPFALDEDTWNDLIAGNATDAWSYNEATDTISSGSDGIKEVNLYPQSTGSPGNRGTVDIGSNNNSTADIARQILHGVTEADMAHHNGVLEFDQNGELFLNGDTGISAGVKDELAAIKGEPRVIPIFRSVTGPGNNAMYKIVKFVGVRILDVKLTGPASKKHVTIQPAAMATKGIIPSTTTGTSDVVYTPAYLIR